MLVLVQYLTLPDSSSARISLGVCFLTTWLRLSTASHVVAEGMLVDDRRPRFMDDGRGRAKGCSPPPEPTTLMARFSLARARVFRALRKAVSEDFSSSELLGAAWPVTPLVSLMST